MTNEDELFETIRNDLPNWANQPEPRPGIFTDVNLPKAERKWKHFYAYTNNGQKAVVCPDYNDATALSRLLHQLTGHTYQVNYINHVDDGRAAFLWAVERFHREKKHTYDIGRSNCTW